MSTKVLVISFSDLGRDPRVERQLLALRDAYTVTAAGTGAPKVEGVEFVPLVYKPSMLWRAKGVVRLLARRHEAFYWSGSEVQSALTALSGRVFDVIVANDIQSLPLAVRLAAACGAGIYCDAHEYEPRHFDGQPLFRLLFGPYWDALCRTYLPKAHAMTTVCEGLAREYEHNYGVRCEVVTNAPVYQELSPTETEPERVRMIYHGSCHPQRRIGNMVRLMDHLDARFSLDLMLLKEPGNEYRRIDNMVASRSNVRVVDPVPMNEIAMRTNGYDLGLFLLWPKSFSYRMALPNKLFEFIQARLAVAVWPSPEMARFVREEGVGLVSDAYTVESMAGMLNALTTEDIMAFKRRAHEAARVHNAEANRKLLRGLVAKACTHGGRRSGGGQPMVAE